MAARGASPDCRERSDQSLKVADPRAVTLTACRRSPSCTLSTLRTMAREYRSLARGCIHADPKNAGRWRPGADYANSIKSVAYAKVGRSEERRVGKEGRYGWSECNEKKRERRSEARKGGG